jgi:hypothetical protein
MNGNPRNFELTRRFARTLTEIDPVRHAAWFEPHEPNPARGAWIFVGCLAVALFCVFLHVSVFEP